MFVIQHLDGTYFHNKGRIILFTEPQEAQNFINMFIQYAMGRLMQEERIGEVMKAQMMSAQCDIKPVNFNINKVECGTVLARELFENI